MAVEYFGQNTNGDNASSPTDLIRYTNAANIKYTCPGSGSMSLKELGARCYDSTGYVRVAIYLASDKTFVAQGSAKLSQSKDNWVTHTTFTNRDGDAITPTLTGGTDYLLAVSGDGGGNIWLVTVTSNYGQYATGDFTETAFPADLDDLSPTGSTAEFCLRAGVEAAAAGSTAVIAGMHAKRRRS